jgi:tetratricopeptide (TPR) repeat protein
MIKNTLKAVNDYAEGYRQALAVYKQAVSYVKANYKDNSDLYKSALKTARNTLETANIPIKESTKESMKKDFQEARKAIREAISVSPSADIMILSSMIREGKMNDAEIRMIMDQHKGNYMDMKLLCDAHGDHFTSVEGITEDLDELEEVLTRYFDNYYAGTDPELNIQIRNTGFSSYAEGGYMARLIQQGDWINRIDSLTDDFVQTYAVQEGN